MAKGKFSSPRKRFTEETPVIPEVPAKAPAALQEEDIPEEFSPVEEHPSSAEISIPDEEAAETSAGKQRKTKQILGILLACVLGICVIICGVFLTVALMDPYDCLILDNVTLGGVNVGGMSQGEARKALEAQLEAGLYSQDLVLTLPRETLRFSAADTAIEVDVRAAVKEAYRLGRTGTDAEKQAVYNSVLSMGAAISLESFLTCNQDLIRGKLQNYADTYDTAYAETAYELKGDAPQLAEEQFSSDAPGQVLAITRGMPRQELDVEDILSQILGAYGVNQLSLDISEIAPLEVPELPDIAAIYEELYVAPVDATVSFETYQPVPGSYGQTFDQEAALQLVSAAADGETVEIPMEYLEPEILRDEVFFRDILGTCDTKHTNDENRNNNLRLLCEALDGVILQPGDEFSYNETVGERTRERGYLPAGAYSGVVLVQDVGGGVCQGSTTLYNCVLQADLEIIFRINHGFTVSYVPIGLDATVNWGGPDFQFKNSANFPIMIQAEVSDGYVRMKLLGTDEKDYYIKMESEYGYGETAIYARSYKCKYDKETDELISRELEARSNYMLP